MISHEVFLTFQIGVPVLFMSLIWCLSPLLGFLLVPLLGSLSDRCKSKLGRRRPFILLLSAGIILGLLLVPNGRNIGILMGDTYLDDYVVATNGKLSNTSGATNNKDALKNNSGFNVFYRGMGVPGPVKATEDDFDNPYKAEPISKDIPTPATRGSSSLHPFSIVFTVLGVILLDFSCDACQSPCRAYMLDVTVPEDHNRGLSTFTVLAGKADFHCWFHFWS